MIACVDPTPTVVSSHPTLDSASAPPTEPSASAPAVTTDAGFSATEPSGVSTELDAALPPEPAPEPRGRIRIVNGAPVTDTGSPLRGVTLGADFGFDFDVQSQADVAAPLVGRMFQRLSQELGLNAVHVYLENWATPPGEAEAFADVLVAESARAGMYLVIGIGTGKPGDGHAGLGWFDPEFVRAFFTRYAARYGALSHVVFEIQNVPEDNCVTPWAAEALDLQRDMYALIRELAPDSHIIVQSYVATPTVASFDANIAQLDGAIAWDNVSVGFHAKDDCVPITEIDNYGAAPSGANVSLLATELPVEDWQVNLLALEERSLGWFSFRWFATSESLDAFRSEHELAGIQWCPDFGTWPLDSANCSPLP